MRMSSREWIAVVSSALVLAACGGRNKAPPPLSSIDLPSGAQLKPFNASNPGRSGPSAMVQLNDKVYLALTNVDANYNPAGPALLVGLVPSTGAQTVIDLGGEGGHQCLNAGHLASDGKQLYVTCSGGFSDSSGSAIVEVNPAGSGSVGRHASGPAGFVPGALAVAPGKVWVGDVNSATLISIDRSSFTLADGAGAGHPAIQLPCTASFTYVSSMAIIGGDLYALCGATDGYLVRLDATTGAQKGSPALVGGQPIALTATGDGRIAVANSTSGDVALVTASASALSATRSPLPNSSDLEDVAARNQFLYVVSAATQTVVKVDLGAPGGFKVVDSRSVSPNTDPTRIVMLDDDVGIVSDYLSGKVVGVRFDVPAPK